MDKGHVALIGAGPGDAGLFTLRGRELLEQAECVIYDRLVGDGVLAMMPQSASKIDVGKTGGGTYISQRGIEEIIVREAKAGKRVARLKGGDPFLFGRGGEELEALNREGIPFEVVPGVTSALAGPECAGIPVTHRGVARSVHIITAHTKEGGIASLDYEALSKLGGTIVFLMGASSVGEICESLLAAGMDGSIPAAAVENAGTAAQRLISGNLETFPAECAAKNLKSPAVILVGETSAFAEEFAWKRFLPLASCKVIVTRPRGRAGQLSAMLRDRGAEVVELPCIAVRRIEAKLPDLSSFDWLGFTSVTGVEAFFKQLCADKRDIRTIGSAKLAAIGPATAKALEERGLRVDLMPEIYDGAHLAAALAAMGGRILMLRAKEGSEELTEVLRSSGADFAETALYETSYERPEVLPRAADAAIFTSASTVRGFCAVMPPDAIKTACCIGAQTAAEAGCAGFKNVITAPKATLESLVNTLEAYMK